MLIPVIVILGIAAAAVLWLILGYNRFVSARNDVEEGWSAMDVFLKKRYDLVPNLVSTVQGYAKHEKETLENVINARNAAANAGSVEERVKNEGELNGALRRLFALAESYPDLKANQNFLNLQDQLSVIEDDIANSRRYYNACVKMLNNLCQQFPSNLIAKMFHFEPAFMYQVDDAAERENVKVEF